MWLSRALVAALLLIPIAAHGGEVSEVKPELSRTVTGFYRWVVAHGNETARLEPHVVQLAGSTRLVVDLSTLDAYTSAFMQSGYFAPEFPSHVAAFYRRSAKSLEKYSKSDFDEMAREGRGPLIDSEDIDVFFCSQEGEYTNRYADGLRVAKAEAKDDTADAEIVTPDGWKTNFKFHKIGTRWLISGYCLYQ